MKRKKPIRKIGKARLLTRAKKAAEEAWKRACRRRDKDTCQMCGAKKEDGAVIQVDHCFTRTCGNLFYDVRNGTCLCKPCHTNKTYKNYNMDRRVDSFVHNREGSAWWTESSAAAEKSGARKYYLEELEQIKSDLDGMFLSDQAYILPQK